MKVKSNGINRITALKFFVALDGLTHISWKMHVGENTNIGTKQTYNSANQLSF